MKRGPTSKLFTKEQMDAALAAAPDQVDDPTAPYDPNDPAAVTAFWSKGTVRSRGQRGAQKEPTKEQVSVRFDPAVLAAFRASGPGWQTRINAALADWLKAHSPDELSV